MDIELKLQEFLTSGRVPHIDVDAVQARAHDIRLHRSCLGTALAEPGAACASARLGAREGALFIGAGSYVNDGGYLKGPVFVGRYCSVGRRVSIGAPMHDLQALSTSPVFRAAAGRSYSEPERHALFGGRRRAVSRPTIMENDIWIGDGAVLMAGVHVGSGAVIGANAVVTRDVAPYDIVAGVNARPVRPRFPPDVVARLLASRWWNLAPEALVHLPAAHVLQALEWLEVERRLTSPRPTMRQLAPLTSEPP